MKNKKDIDDNLNDVIEFDNDNYDKDTNELESNNTDTLSKDEKTKNAKKVNSPTLNNQSDPSIKNNHNVDIQDSDSKFFAIRITGGQENVVANILQNKINSKRISLRSILILENFKGYVIVEAPDSNIAYDALYGVRHVRGQIRGDLPFSDIEKYLIKKPVVTELSIDDTVEVIAGPFKSMKAKIIRVDYEKQEATVVLLDSPYQIPVTVDANYLKKTSG
ncbi:MAG: transcription elongation factor Spt5 [Nitrososphaeraceae archaeon]|jgi:transcriptional antiterminator NusG|nr:transcription elongation factor Spt5 [Nitrososphaeraceae archaeon]MDW3610587.1 transcription elongation factor Spt5 [Nitrososphaeraceae archaeon]